MYIFQTYGILGMEIYTKIFMHNGIHVRALVQIYIYLN